MISQNAKNTIYFIVKYFFVYFSRKILILISVNLLDNRYWNILEQKKKYRSSDR